VERAPLTSADSAREVNRIVTDWSAQWGGDSLLAVEHQNQSDDRGHFHWLIRLRGQEKKVITVWLSLRQRSLFSETELMPAPEESREEVYQYCLVRNAEMREVHVAIGPEGGLYVVASLPATELSVGRLDELVGATVHYVEEMYPTVMSLGLPASIVDAQRKK
jgi:Putative bacterial sensory transduction regulator